MSTALITDPRHNTAQLIDEAWTRLNQERHKWLSKGAEVRAFVTAQSTADTSVGSLPWKNNTTIPKLTQIADNLQSFYMAALMPNDDDFIRWEGADDKSITKANIIEQYMRTKIRSGRFRDDLIKIIRDWIMYGNCFGGVKYVKEFTKSPVDGSEIVTYQGPKVFRISPIDCVIDPQADSFDDSLFIYRQIVPIVDVLSHNETHPDDPYDPEALDNIRLLRGGSAPTDWIDFYKQRGLSIDGFESWSTYLSSQYIELLHFWGDLYIPETGEVLRNQHITIADRSWELTRTQNPAWNGKKPFFHVAWRVLPDNLYGQGPLDNLVGMQYRCDHLENLKADAFDQIAHPFFAVIGDDVDDFEFEPGGKVFLPDGANVVPIRPDATVLQADNQIAMYHKLMEEMAGSPREAMGFRTEGEKTAFEISVLQQGADRNFQDKLNHFESQGMFQILNLMYEIAMRNLDVVDIARTFNDETEAMELMTFTREDVVADGILYPTGAKHFADRNKRIQELSNLLQLLSSDKLNAHFSGVQLSKMLATELGFDKWNLVDDFVGLKENAQAEQLILQLRQTLNSLLNPSEPTGGELVEQAVDESQQQ